LRFTEALAPGSGPAWWPPTGPRSGESAGRCFSDPVILALPLPSISGNEVLIDVKRVAGCGLPPPPEPGFLLDDLRVERGFPARAPTMG
jgi:hypothetical protein